MRLSIANLKAALNVMRGNYSYFDLWNRWQGIPPPTNKAALIKDHFRSWVYICASRNAETIAGIPLKLYVRGGTLSYYGRRALSPIRKSYLQAITGKAADDVEEITEGHPLLDLLDYMNGEQTRSEVIEASVTWQEVTGDSYWYLEPGPLGLPQAIWPLMAQYMRVVRDPEGRLTGYLYGKNENDRVALDVNDVLHFKYPNPSNPDYGLSPLEASFGAAAILEAEQVYEHALYKNRGLPEVGIIVKGGISQDERKRMYSEWADKYEGASRAGKPIILQGDMDIRTFGFPPRDIGIQFTQKFAREEIAAAFGVPMTLLEMSQAARAGAEAGHYAYMKFTIAPKLKRISEKLTEQLASRYDTRLFLAFDDPVPDDEAFALEQSKAWLSLGVTTVNEERAKAGMEPVEWGEEPILPAGMRPLSEKPEPVAPPIAPEAAPEEPAEEEEEDEAAPKAVKGVEPLTPVEQKFTDQLEKHFGKLRRQVLTHMGEV